MPIVLAILCSSLILLCSPTRWGPLVSYAYSTPFIVLCAASLAKSRSKQALDAAVLCFTIPAVGYFAWQNTLLQADLSYVREFEASAHTLRLIKNYADGTGWLLLSAGGAALCLKSWRLGGLIALGGLWSIGCQYALRLATKDVDMGFVMDGSTALIWIERSRWLPLLVATVLSIKLNKNKILAMLLTGVLCAWMASPRSAFYLNQIEIGTSSQGGPVGRADIGIGVVGANPQSPDFYKQLEAQGRRPLSGRPWHCDTNTRPKWRKMTRAMGALQLDADHTFSILSPHWATLLERGVGRLTLLGKAKEAGRGPLSKHLANPAVHFYLDPIPKEAVQATIEKGGVRWVDKEPLRAEACAFWITDEIKIQEVFTIGQKWRRPNPHCSDRLFIVRGERPRSGEWTPPIPCPFPMAIEPKME